MENVKKTKICLCYGGNFMGPTPRWRAEGSKLLLREGESVFLHGQPSWYICVYVYIYIYYANMRNLHIWVTYINNLYHIWTTFLINIYTYKTFILYMQTWEIYLHIWVTYIDNLYHI